MKQTRSYFQSSANTLQGVEAVIDKDACGAKLANEIDADGFIITAIPRNRDASAAAIPGMFSGEEFEMVTIVSSEYTILGQLLPEGHILALIIEPSSNMGLIRSKVKDASQRLVPML